MKVKKYFGIKELVCSHIRTRYSEAQIWSFFDPRLLDTLVAIREILNAPMVVNSDKLGFTQRGIRCNCCQIVKDKTMKGQTYMSAHIRGTAVDFHSPGRTAEEIRKIIKQNQDKLPYPIRLEADVTWVHVDVDNYSGLKVVEFKA